MDEWHFEIAAKVEAAAREAAIDRARARQSDRYPDWDGETCFKCGDDLPRVRIDNHRVFCIYCQEYRERHHIKD